MTRREFVVSAAAPAIQAQSPDWRGQGILALDRSPNARLRNIPVRAVRMGPGFWEPRRRVNVERSIPTLLELLEKNGIVDNFRRLAGKDVARRGPLYTDSDLYKWIEAAAFVLQSGDDPKLRSAIDRLTGDILAAQEPSGYLNTYFVRENRDRRWQEQYSGHESYCLGHLLQGALAYHRATGNARLLEGGVKFVDYLIRDFGPGKQPLLTGHPELEMALVELYRTTGDRRHLDLAGYLLHGDGERLKLRPSQYVYIFSGKPFTSRTKLEGHAVRAMYACCGATDYFLETGEQPYWKTLSLLWDDMTRSKMYITGGVGSRSAGEAFGEPYELPNRLAYTESCAAIASMMWNWRLLAAAGEARFADVIERALYNGINSGTSLEGTLYCYRNPLELIGDPNDRIRNPWYDTTCCPPNLQRTFAALPGYMYSVAEDGVYVHLYHASEMIWRLANGADLRLTQATEYPWAGRVEIDVSLSQDSEFTLYARIPGWTSSAKVTVNGKPAQGAPKAGEYFPIRKRWTRGDRVTLAFDMTPQLVASNPRVPENVGRAAVQVGPLVYCMEGLDQNVEGSIFDVAINPAAPFVPEVRKDFLGGMTVLKHAGFVMPPSDRRPLYSRFLPKAPRRAAELTFIPYYAFANRGFTPMMVWLPVG